MIPTLPSTGDIPVGPERPEPVQVPPPMTTRTRLDDLEDLKKAILELQAKVESLEARVTRLEAGTGRLS